MGDAAVHEGPVGGRLAGGADHLRIQDFFRVHIFLHPGAIHIQGTQGAGKDLLHRLEVTVRRGHFQDIAFIPAGIRTAAKGRPDRSVWDSLVLERPLQPVGGDGEEFFPEIGGHQRLGRIHLRSGDPRGRIRHFERSRFSLPQAEGRGLPGVPEIGFRRSLGIAATLDQHGKDVHLLAHFPRIDIARDDDGLGHIRSGHGGEGNQQHRVQHRRIIDRNGVKMEDRRMAVALGIASATGIHAAPGQEARPLERRLVHPRADNGEIRISLFSLAAYHIIRDAAAKGPRLDPFVPGKLGQRLRWHSY